MRKKKIDDPLILAALMALSEELAETPHDTDIAKLTIKRTNTTSAWSLKTNLMREVPTRLY